MCSDAELDWDGSSSWLCKTCGRIGHHQFTIHTKPMSNLDATKDVQGQFLAAIPIRIPAPTQAVVTSTPDKNPNQAVL